METSKTTSGEVRTTGTVIRHKAGRRGGATIGALVYPVVRFRTRDGEEVEFESSTGSNAPPKVGADIEVVYKPSDPQGARVPLASVSRFGLAPFYLAGGFILVVGGLMMLTALVFVGLVLLVALSG